jgi:branched-chain amino acid transport system permease protein
MRLLRSLVKTVAAYALLAGSISLLAGAGLVNPYWIQIFMLACIVAISAQGLNLIYGYAGLFSLGHAAFYGIGAYTAAYLMKTYGGQSQLAFLAALLAGGASRPRSPTSSDCPRCGSPRTTWGSQPWGSGSS